MLVEILPFLAYIILLCSCTVAAAELTSSALVCWLKRRDYTNETVAYQNNFEQELAQENKMIYNLENLKDPVCLENLLVQLNEAGFTREPNLFYYIFLPNYNGTYKINKQKAQENKEVMQLVREYGCNMFD